MKIGVVIPTLNEAPRLPARIAELRADPSVADIVVVDGGSTDDTVEIARGRGVKVLSCDPGRGRQLALGAGHVAGDVLLFLHADTQFAAGAGAAVVAALEHDEHAVGGNFRLRFDGGDAFSRWLDGFYAFIRHAGLYYGDSAIFVRRRVYDAVGAIRPIALMEDYDFVRRMAKAGRTLNICEPTLWTSSRRFRGRKPAEIVWGWVKIHLLYWIGWSPDRLAQMYDSSRQRERRDVDARDKTGGSSFSAQS